MKFPTQNAQARPAMTADQLAGELSPLLAAMTTTAEEYLTSLRSHREAVRKADPVMMSKTIAHEAECLERLSKLEESRRSLVNRAEAAGLWVGRGPITLSGLAAKAPEDRKGLLVSAASKLRAIMEEATREQGVLRQAAASLAGDVEGIVRQVAQSLSHTGTYGRMGVVAAGPAVVSALDLRS